jgi:pentatricopeptide repeat protein
LQNVAPELAVELFWKTELWFRAQGPKVYEWNEVVYAFVLANHYEEAWDLVTSMEDASEMPVSWINLRVHAGRRDGEVRWWFHVFALS